MNNQRVRTDDWSPDRSDLPARTVAGRCAVESGISRASKMLGELTCVRVTVVSRGSSGRRWPACGRATSGFDLREYLRTGDLTLSFPSRNFVQVRATRTPTPTERPGTRGWTKSETFTLNGNLLSGSEQAKIVTLAPELSTSLKRWCVRVL